MPTPAPINASMVVATRGQRPLGAPARPALSVAFAGSAGRAREKRTGSIIEAGTTAAATHAGSSLGRTPIATLAQRHLREGGTGAVE